MVIVLYSVLPERIAALHKVYSAYAIFALNTAAVVFWLAAMAALAARRATFKYATTIDACYNYGSGGVCVRKRDGLEGRDVDVATYPYLNMMSAAAGLSGIEMSVTTRERSPKLTSANTEPCRLLFIATLVIFFVNFRKQNGPAPKVENVEAHGMQQQSHNFSQDTQYPQQVPQQYPQQSHHAELSGQQYQAVQQ